MIIKGLDSGSLVNFVNSKYDILKENRKVKEAIWLKCFNNYQSVLPPIWKDRIKDQGRSARFLAESFASVESLHSQYMALLVPNRNWHSAEPAQRGKLPFDDNAAKQITSLLDGQLYRSHFTKPLGMYVRQLQIFGNAPWKIEWHKSRVTDYPAYDKAMSAWENEHHGKWLQYLDAMEQWKQQVAEAEGAGLPAPPQPQEDMPEPPRVGDGIVTDRYPELIVGDIFNFVQDPFSMDPNNPLVINHSWTSLAALKRLAVPNNIGFRVYDNLGDLVESDRRDADSQYMEERLEVLGMTVPEDDAIELHEMMGTMEIPGGGPGRKVDKDLGGEGNDLFVSFIITVANRKTLIRAEPTFLWSGQSPWRLGTYRAATAQEIYGIGQLEKSLGEQDLINARANQNIDVVNHAIDPEYKAVDDEVLDLKLKSAPGRIRLVGDINNLVELRKNLNGLGISFQDLEMLKNDFQRLTLSTAPLGGQSKESATKTALDASSVSAEVNKIARYIEEHSLEDMLNMMMQFNAQYIDKKEMVKIDQSGKTDFVELSPESIRSGWTIRAHGAQHLVLRQERIQNILMFMQLIAGNPLLLPAVNIIELAKMVFEELGFTNTDQIFNDEARAEQILDAMLRNGMVGNAGAGGNDGQGAGGPGAAGAQEQSGNGGTGEEDPVAVARQIGESLIGGQAVGA